MTVMILIDFLTKIGGAERSLFLLAQGLRDRGHRVIIACLKDGEVAENMRQDEFRVEKLNVSKIYDVSGVRAFFRLVEIVKRERVSIIMSYHESSDYLGLLLAVSSRVPIISSRRDMGYRLKMRHKFFYRVINKFFDHIVAVSFGVKKSICDGQHTAASDISVIYNGVDLGSHKIHSSGRMQGLQCVDFEDGCLNVCCLSHIRPVKGHKYLVEATDALVKRFPGVRVFFVGLWERDVVTYNELQGQIEDFGLGKVIRFTGGVLNADVPPLLADMDIVVCPSLSEGMPNAVLEAMAAKKPVVATAVGGNLEVVVDGKTGFLVPPKDPQAIAEALLKLLTNVELRIEMGLRGRSRVESEFSVGKMVERYEDLLQYVYLKRETDSWHSFYSVVLKIIKKIGLWVRFFLASVAYHAGFVFAFRWVKRVLHLGKVKILCFHDVSMMAEGRSNFSIFIRPDFFAEFLDLLVQNYQVATLEEATQLLQANKPLTDDVFALTFDDGYKGWIKHVLPECQKRELPYTVFVATEPLDSGIPLLYPSLLFLAENTWRKVVDLTPWQLDVFILDGPDSILHFVEEIHECWRGRSKANRHQFLKELSVYLGVSLNGAKSQKLLLNWDDLGKLEINGVAIGAHTVSHGCLGRLTEEECSWEVSHSKHRLEEELGHPVNSFAYPYGASDDYQPITIDVVRKAGFQNAFTLGTKMSDGFKPYEIGRRSVSSGMFSTPNGKFCKPLLLTELSGLGDILFGRIFPRKKYVTEPSLNNESVSVKYPK